jgi:hypothetical protein
VISSGDLLGWELRRHGRQVVDDVRVHPPQRLRHEQAVAVPRTAFREVDLIVGVGLAAGYGRGRPEQLLVPLLPVTLADPEAHAGGNLNPLALARPNRA